MFQTLRKLFSPQPVSLEHPGACLGVLKAIHERGGCVGEADDILNENSAEVSAAIRRGLLGDGSGWGATIYLTEHGRAVVERWSVY